MDWTEVTIFTATAGIEPVTALLETMEIYGYALEDAADFAEFLESTEIYWDYVDETLKQTLSTQETKIKIYLPDSPEGEAQYQELTARLAALKAADSENAWGRLQTETALTRQADWEWGWKQYFKPFPVGERFLIKPSWEDCAPEEGRILLEIDPASSFGTGSHDTTQLCIRALEETVRGGERLLDLGTGSGILAIAASLLGAKAELAVDIDEHCLACAAENAEKNGVAIARTLHGDVLKDPALAERLGSGYDIICANIVADILIQMAPLFREKLAKGGTLICSGILNERAAEVEAALLAQGFPAPRRTSTDDWSAFIAKKPL